MARSNPLKISQDQAQAQAQLPMSFPTQAVEYNGQTIHIAEEMNLTEMWKASGKSVSNKPIERIRYMGNDFVAMMQEKVGCTHLLRTVKGRNGGTFAHWQIGMEYARYLSPELAAVCNQIVKDFVDAKPEIAQSVTARTTQKGVLSLAKVHERDEVNELCPPRAVAPVAPVTSLQIQEKVCYS